MDTPLLIVSPDDLPPALAASVSAEERVFIQKLKTAWQKPESRSTMAEFNGLPFAVTSHFASLAGPEHNDPIRRQFMPDPREELEDSLALDDPLGEVHFRITPRLVHQYRDRVLLLAGGSCAGFCRYCFRRIRMSSPAGFISAEELSPVLAYLESKSGIREILISGGDPLTAEDAALEELFCKLRKARPGILIRLCTRVPVTNPARLKEETIALFTRYRPLRIVTHINHPRELAPVTSRALTALVEAGIPVHVQTVLLSGINDNAETLEELFAKCLAIGISPYYLFQLDLAPGTAHFRVPLRKGLSIYRDLELRVGGLGLPAYAVDLPGGGGKIRLHEGVIAGEKSGDVTGGGPGGKKSSKVFLLRGLDGKLWRYPAD